MALYRDVFEQLVSREFLEQHAYFIQDRLRHAAEEFKSDDSRMSAANLCLHMASEIILANPRYLKSALDKLRETEGLKGNDDPTFLVTVSVLYYVLHSDAAWTNETDIDYLIKLRRGFDEMNWLIGKDAMRVLGL